MVRFRAAAWSTLLVAVSWLATGLIVAVCLTVAGVIRGEVRLPFPGPYGVTLALLLPPLVLLGSALFVVRGYEVRPGELRVERLLWSTRLDLAGPFRICADPAAMRGSLRLFGNGGLYSITGLFQNRALGRYRAFVTDPKMAVVLFLPPRTVVVSPADPAGFVTQLRAFVPGVSVVELPVRL